MMSQTTSTFIVNEDSHKLRLDKFLVETSLELTRSRIQSLISDGNVLVNNQAITSSSHKVKSGDEISVLVPPPEISTMKPANIKLDIVYEDDDLLVIDKQAGLTIHPGAGNHQDTMANALLAYCGDSLSGIGGVQRPGIVHRLDKDTSGLLVVAKNDKTHLSLSEQLQERTLKRKYNALVWGTPFPPIGKIETMIGRHHKDRTKMAVVKNDGRHSVTHYKVLESFADKEFSLIECRLETGRTHQIRVHLQHLGFSIIGDRVYGKSHLNVKRDKYSEQSAKFIKHFKRQALHSKYIGFIHPISNEFMEFSSDFNDKKPADIYELYLKLQETI